MTTTASRALALPIVSTSNDDDELGSFPQLYAGWLRELLEGGIPRERLATCANCVMCSPSESLHSGKFAFDPGVKCCSYTPELPNYLVGQILATTSPELAYGRAAIGRRIQDKIAVTPLGVGMTPSYRHVYEAARGQVFGRSRALLCPYFDSAAEGRCSIWRHRNSVCATYFCKHLRGAVGQQFWAALRELLVIVETELSVQFALQRGCDPNVLIGVLEKRNAPASESLGVELVAEELRHLRQPGWGSWEGRPVEFYMDCAEQVSNLSWAQVIAICGPRTRARAAALRASYRGLTHREIPRRLQVGTFPMQLEGEGRVRIATYSYMDPIVLSKRVFDLLHYFDGRSDTRDTINRIASLEGIEIDEKLVIKLVDHDVLREIPETP